MESNEFGEANIKPQENIQNNSAAPVQPVPVNSSPPPSPEEKENRKIGFTAAIIVLTLIIVILSAVLIVKSRGDKKVNDKPQVSASDSVNKKEEPSSVPVAPSGDKTDNTAPDPYAGNNKLTVYRTFDLDDYCLYVRTGPSTDFAIIYKLYEGDEVGVTDWRDGWAYITVSYGRYGWTEHKAGTELKGWVCGDYLKAVSD